MKNFPGKKKFMFCADHEINGMINVKAKKKISLR